MKKSSLFILKSFAGPFILTFCIATFVLLMQTVWKYIEDMVGKGLEFHVIGELLFYISASMVPLALPLAILLSSLMTFGNLGENYELVAFRSAGISLQRVMRPMAFLILLLSVVAFLFSNYMLPVANLKMRSLLYDIMQQKPSVNILPGIFYNEIDGYTIKVKEKNQSDKGDILSDVMIYDHTEKMGNRKVITAKSGMMRNTDDNQFLEITLYDGYAYDDQTVKKKGGTQYNHFKNRFREKKIMIDMSQFELNRTDEDLFKSHYEMLNMQQLTDAVDTLEQVNQDRLGLFKESIARNVSLLNLPYRSLDSIEIAGFDPWETFKNESLNERKAVFTHAANACRGIKTRANAGSLEFEGRQVMIIKHVVQWHKKLTLSYACIVLFLIGAPLGSIIRKGGLGMPVVVSVVFFLLFHILNITGEKLSKEMVLDPSFGMWIAPLVLTPVGIFITYKATSDSTLLDLGSYAEFFKRLFRKKPK
ncbi:MAG: LptF/LptG family permease [Vicingaceae bacterium]